MVINDTIFNVDCIDVIKELQAQLHLNKINLLNAVNDTPDNVMISCPYHKEGQERRPSMGVKKSDGTCHCFACGEVVGLPQMISHCWGHDSAIGAFGWEWLLKNFLTVSVEERKDLELDFSRETKHTKQTEYVSEEELDSYRYIHPYMYKRKLTDEIIELFDIGYDQKRQCITFPIRDKTGGTLFIARRSVNTKYFNYPSGAEKPIYGLFEIYRLGEFPKEIIICESMLDALTCWVYGKYAVALNGLGNDLQFKQLMAMPCRKFILGTDMDDAGLQARERIRKNVKGKIIAEYLWDRNIAKDFNDMSEDYFNSLKETL